MKLSSVLGAQIKSRDGKINGCVLGARHGGGVIKYLHCSDDDDNEFFVDVRKATFGEVITFERACAVNKNYRPIRLGSNIYSDKGNFLGHLTEVDCQELKIKKAFSRNKTYPANRLIFADAVIVKTRK